ncbi:MAG: rRNA pseudouridine synthase [Deltaproteobacteria bacterium]|nr:rRNA pseudouridine synthase [Deltaproteobacteria bacterium]MBW2658753.1 rRNA pseudouridine synthase [Deltaproteobacteria bacterium]
MNNSPVRLQKYLAQCGVASRRKCEELIVSGRIAVDGDIVVEMGKKIIPGKSRITMDGRPVKSREKAVYYLLNKPKGYVTTLSDPQGRPVVVSLIKNGSSRLFPVGRLDLDTEGALILTNDGQFAQKVQHPSNETRKTYEAEIKGQPHRATLAALEKGILLEGKITAPAKVSLLARRGNSSLIRITIHEGRKRQVRKMFAHMGHPVFHLKRTAYGKLFLGNLSSGKYRQLDSRDLKKVFL